MLKCNRYEDLIMRYFDHDLSRPELEKLNQHLDSCSNCRLLFSQLGGILGTLENTVPAEPEPHIERLVMEQIMLIPAKQGNKELYRSVRQVYGTLAGIIAFLVWITSLTIQDWSLTDLILAARNYLDVLFGYIVDLQIVYQIVAGLFPSEIISLLFRIQFIFIIGIFMLVFLAMRTAPGRPTGANRDVS
jgi:hypothetical protein